MRFIFYLESTNLVPTKRRNYEPQKKNKAPPIEKLWQYAKEIRVLAAILKQDSV